MDETYFYGPYSFVDLSFRPESPRFYINYDIGDSYLSFNPRLLIEDVSTASFSGFDSSLAGYDWKINVLSPLPLPDTGDLESLLEDAESIINENYTSASWARFQTVLQAARTLLTQSSYTQEEVDTAYLELQSAIEGLTIDKPPPEESSEPDKPPPIVIGGYDVPKSMLNAVSTGDITDIVTDFVRPFLDHAMSAFSFVIPLLGLFLATKLIPKIFRFFVR